MFARKYHMQFFFQPARCDRVAFVTFAQSRQPTSVGNSVYKNLIIYCNILSAKYDYVTGMYGDRWTLLGVDFLFSIVEAGIVSSAAALHCRVCVASSCISFACSLVSRC